MPVLEAVAPAKSKRKRKKRETQHQWTYTDYLTLDDEKRYEIIEGELFMAPAPLVFHQEISSELFGMIWTFVKKNELGKVLAAPIDVILSDNSITQPDIVFVAKDNYQVIAKHGLIGPPDFVVEIISPSSIRRDRHQKKMLYEKFGIKEYWIVDPANKSIEQFNIVDGKYELTGFAAEKGTVISQVIDGLEIKVEEIMPPDSDMKG